MTTARTARSRRAARNAARRWALSIFVFVFWIPILADVTLVDASGATAGIEAPANLTDAEARAVADFSDALESMARGGKPGQGEPVGRVVLERTGEPPASLSDSEAFSAIASNNVLRLRAKTPEGLTQAIYWFLRTHGGVRWYAPTEAAAVPEKRPWTLPDFSETPVPSFESRVLYGLAGGDGALWARRNGLGNPVAFSHHLANVITPDLLRENPNWNCVFAGVRIPPVRARFYQPELQRPALALAAARSAADFFSKNPNAFSFSLGLEDNTRFSQSDDALRARGPLRFYRGLPDYSDTVFSFMNRAGKALNEDGHAQKLLGCLAYQWNTNVPSFSLSPNVTPFVASDRSFWHEENFRRDETALLQRWGGSGARMFGLYDYLYGNPFLIPRPLERLPQWLKAGHAAGARLYFAEAYPDPAYDAQKLWIAAALLWDINADPRALADEWMTFRYGNAAPHIRSFFARWEQAWETQTENTYWLRNYWDEAQGLLATPADLDEMEKCLAQAAASVEADPKRAVAVAALQTRFALTDAFCRLVNAKAALAAAPPPRDAREAARLYENLVAFLNARAHWNALLKTAPAAVRNAAEHTERSDPSVGALVSLAQRARAQGRLRSFMASLRPLASYPGTTAGFRDALAALDRPEIPGPQLERNFLKNPSLHATRGATPLDFNPPWPKYAEDLPDEWSLRALRNETLGLRLECVPGRRANALAVSGAENAHLFQWVNLPAGEPSFFAIQIRGRVPEGTLVLLILTWDDENGVRHDRETRLFPGDYPDGRTLWAVTQAFAKPARCALGIILAHQPEGELEISAPQVRRIPRLRD